MASGSRCFPTFLALALMPALCVGATYARIALGASRPAVGDVIEIRPDAAFRASAAAVVIPTGADGAAGRACTIRTGADATGRGSLLIFQRDASGAYLAHWQAVAEEAGQPDCGASADLRLEARAAAALWSSNLLEAISAYVLPATDEAQPFG